MENRYGVDVEYFKKELAALSRSLPNRTPDELDRYLRRLADVAKPPKSKERRKTVRRVRPCNKPQERHCSEPNGSEAADDVGRDSYF